jgi:hypothetical protein
MKSLFDKNAVDELSGRINKLSAASEREWGKMDVAQMLAHCAITMEVATGQRHPARMFIGRVLGPIFKSDYMGPKPLRKGSPTDKSFIVQDARDFNTEKERLLKLIKQFAAGGEAACTRHPHAFFGRLTPAEWAISSYKHLDHHLQQFGV